MAVTMQNPPHLTECKLADFIRKFSSKKTPNKVELAEFRNYVSQLKKQGKIPAGLKRGSKPVNAATARPRDLRGGKTLAEIVNANKASLKPFTSKRKLTPELPFNLIDLPLEHSDLAGILRELEDDPKKFNYLIEPGDRFAFEIEGTGGLHFYSDLGVMANELLDSDGIQNLFDKRADSQHLLRSLKIVRWPKRKNKAAYLKQRKVRRPLTGKAKADKNAADAARKRRKK